MKQFILSCMILLTCSASAQDVPGVSVDFGIQGNIISSNINATVRDIAGLPPPTSPYQIALEEVYGLGLGGGIHLDVDIGLLSFRVSGDYITLAPDEEKFTDAVEIYFPGASIDYVEGGTIEMISGNVNLKLVVLPIPLVNPYLTGGGGLTYLKTTKVKLAFGGNPIPEFEILKEQTVGTVNVGAGVDFDLSVLTLYAELKINWLFIEEGSSTFVPIGTVGVTF